MSEIDLKSRIKNMMVENLMLKMAPEEIGDDTLLFSPEGLALDSIDALELAVGIEKNFGIATPNAEVAREAFVSVNTIAAYIIAKKKNAQETPPS
ncbi:MAG TPA: phosphopantetheine-binding protein [Terrimicrobiaceae bacterium]